MIWLRALIAVIEVSIRIVARLEPTAKNILLSVAMVASVGFVFLLLQKTRRDS